MGQKGTLFLLAVAVVVGLASLVLAFREPSRVGPWATVLSMTCVVAAQIIRWRQLNKHGQ